ncbi:hypothetical protein BST61_g2879 [Cercospora zeina]
MGRRKIEIKPIRDDRNRSVTFLKRKGGLFKKAHELSVLCSVDVAVVIFGHNKKLYEYSSSDINEIIGRVQYYGGAHEHKGPQDFADKNGGDEDDDDGEGGDDMGGDEHRGTPQPDPSMMHAHMAHHPGFQHVRHGTPQASPPMHNGAMPQFTRGPSPLPPGMTVSRPNSRNAQHPGGPQHIRRTSSNLVPQHQQGPPPSYAYQPNPPFYNPQAAQMQGRPPPGPVPPPGAYPTPYPPQQPQHPPMQQAFMEDQRRSMPPNYPQQPPPPQPNMQRHPSGDHLAPPGQPAQPSPRLQQQQRPTPSPQPHQNEFQSPPLPQPKPLPAHAKAHSIFTPIDDSRSMLAQHWGGPSNAEPRSDLVAKIDGGGPRSQSIDVAQMQRDNHAKANGLSPRPPPSVPPPTTQSATQSPQAPHRSATTPTMTGPGRSGSVQTEAKRPRLKVQIPSEQSGDEGGTAGSAQDLNTSSEAQTANTTADQPQVPAHGVVLPPPSPSAGALLSAGAQGPPNPFARPAPPMSTNPHAANREASHVETPLSALPSRFMTNELLPSPSAFYPQDWNNNMLPSPFTFQTPVAGNGPSWRTEDERKRGNDDQAEDGNDPKRVKT